MTDEWPTERELLSCECLETVAVDNYHNFFSWSGLAMSTRTGVCNDCLERKPLRSVNHMPTDKQGFMRELCQPCLYKKVNRP